MQVTKLKNKKKSFWERGFLSKTLNLLPNASKSD